MQPQLFLLVSSSAAAGSARSDRSVEIHHRMDCRTTGKAPAMAALAYHRATGRRAAVPNQRLGYGENFLYMLDAGAKVHALQQSPE